MSREEKKRKRVWSCDRHCDWCIDFSYSLSLSLAIVFVSSVSPSASPSIDWIGAKTKKDEAQCERHVDGIQR